MGHVADIVSWVDVSLEPEVPGSIPAASSHFSDKMSLYIARSLFTWKMN